MTHSLDISSFLVLWALLTAALWLARELIVVCFGRPAAGELGRPARRDPWFARCDTLSFLPIALSVFQVYFEFRVVYGGAGARTVVLDFAAASAGIFWLVITLLAYGVYTYYNAMATGYATLMNRYKSWSALPIREKIAYGSYGLAFVLAPWGVIFYISLLPRI